MQKSLIKISKLDIGYLAETICPYMKQATEGQYGNNLKEGMCSVGHSIACVQRPIIAAIQYFDEKNENINFELDICYSNTEDEHKKKRIPTKIIEIHITNNGEIVCVYDERYNEEGIFLSDNNQEVTVNNNTYARLLFTLLNTIDNDINCEQKFIVIIKKFNFKPITV